MRFAPHPAPSKAELDRVRRVLFPADETDSDSEEEKEEKEHQHVTHSPAKPEREIMSANDKSKSRKKKEVGGIKIKNVFQLDPNVEVFNRQSTRRAKRCLSLSKSSAPVAAAARSDEELARSLESSSGSKTVDGDDATPSSKGTASSSNDGASDTAALSGASPSRRRFEPPFKTPPSASASSSWIASKSSSNEAMTQSEKTPPFKTPPRSPTPGDKDKVEGEVHDSNEADQNEKSPDDSASSRGKCREGDTSPSSPKEATAATPSGKRKLFTNAKVPVDQLPSPTKKPPRSKLPKVQLKMRPANSKTPTPKKKEKPNTAKDRAEAYRVANRGKILRDMEKHKSDIGSLLERRKQKKNLQESQDNPSPERAE